MKEFFGVFINLDYDVWHLNRRINRAFIPHFGYGLRSGLAHDIRVDECFSRVYGWISREAGEDTALDTLPQCEIDRKSEHDAYSFAIRFCKNLMPSGIAQVFSPTISF